jgi:hypothetical protein
MEDMAQRSSWKFTVLGVVLLLGAGGSVPAILANVTDHRNALASVHWPTTQGTVLSSSIAMHQGHTQPYWRVAVRYDYQVGGVVHQGGRLGAYGNNGEYGRDEAAARAFVASVPAGARVTVHYDPDHPDTAMLSPAAPETGMVGTALFAIMGGLLLLGAIACFVRVARGPRPAPLPDAE